MWGEGSRRWSRAVVRLLHPPPPPPLLVLSTTVGREEREMRTGGEEVDAVTVTVTVTLARYRSLLLRERRGERWGDELGRGLR